MRVRDTRYEGLDGIGSQPSRRQFLRLASLAGAALATSTLTACQSTDRSQTDRQLRYLVAESFWGNWNPYDQGTQVQAKVQRLLFDRLLEVQPDTSLASGLAERWRQVDARTWEFNLRKGLTFHGGQPLTADDVKVSIELATGLSGQKVVSAAQWGVPHEVHVVDPHLVRIRGTKPYGPLLNMLAITDIVSRQDVSKGIKQLEKAPNGTGAFRLADDQPNKKVMEAFAGHYRGAAKLERVEWEFIQDPQTRLNALLSGQAEMIDRVEPDQIPTLQRRSDQRLLSATTLEMQILFLRTNTGPFAKNPALRRAVAWGIDRQACAGLIGGKTQVAQSHVAPNMLYFHPQTPSYQFDPQRAKAELQAARVAMPVEVELLGSRGFYPKSQECIELIAQNLDEVGFRVKTTTLEVAAFLDQMAGGRGSLMYGGWGTAAPDPNLSLGSLYSSGGAGGLWGINDTKLEAYLVRGVTTVEPAERERVYADVQRYLWQTLPAIPLFANQNVQAVRQGVEGVAIGPTPQIDFWPVSITS